jgi:hypothetical protein
MVTIEWTTCSHAESTLSEAGDENGAGSGSGDDGARAYISFDASQAT